MTAAAPILNTLLLGAVVGIVTLALPGARRRDLIMGALAAVCAIAALLIFRFAAVSGTARTGIPFPTRHLVLNLAALALVEELAKYAVVAPWRLDNPGTARTSRGNRNPRNAHAVGRGLGFATVEHLLFLLIPPVVFLRRLLLATPLHAGTALLYARPGILRRRGINGTAPITDVLLITIGTTIHLTYNLLLQGLDGLTIF